MVRAALDQFIRFIVCPTLVDELRDVLHRGRFRKYLTSDEADVLIDSIEAGSELVSDPEDVESLSPDPKDDYLIALAREAGVQGIISGDSDTDVLNGPPVFTPREALGLLSLTEEQRSVIVVALWNLHLRMEQAKPPDSRLAAYVEVIGSATRKLGGDPSIPLFNVPKLVEVEADLRDLSRDERTLCAYALELDRRTTSHVHAEHVEGIEDLTNAFDISDRFEALERFLDPGRPHGRR